MRRHVITANGATASEVLVGRGTATEAATWVPSTGSRKVAVVAQPTVASLAEAVATALGPSAGAVLFVPDGEAAKRFAVVEETHRRLNERALTRDDLVVGVGGGALTDLAGFVSATYLRGIDVENVPTTLLGAVDAAIGGKTAVNVDGKNLAGAFHHPRRVIIDLDVLASLPVGLVREGCAEALKAGLIADPVLVDLFAVSGIEAPLEEVVNRAVEVKCRVVSDDFRETGQRAILNYGHTIGHAIETAAGISHGEAVAIGMVAAGRASAAVTGFAEEERQRALIAGLGLPVVAPSVDPVEVERLLGLDKKRDARGQKMVLLRRIGEPEVVHVDATTVRAALHSVGVA